MILEYAQILSTVCRDSGIDAGYQATHRNNPCVIWAGESLDNWTYLRYLALEVCKEYSYRYNGRRHVSQSVIESLPYPNIDSSKPISLPPQCMPNDVKDDDVVIAYRNYYIVYKQHIAKWTGRGAPNWFNFEGERIE